jgi:hypothetical protein
VAIKKMFKIERRKRSKNELYIYISTRCFVYIPGPRAIKRDKKITNL